MLRAVELIRLRLPFVRPFRTALGTTSERDLLLVHAIAEGSFGWGECVALNAPTYTSEYTAEAHAVLRDHLVPLVLGAAATPVLEIPALLRPIAGHRMAKAALETAVLDADLRAQRRSLADFLGAERTSVACGVAVGIPDSVDALIDSVENYRHDGYRRFKLKIAPGWDREPLRALRDHFGPELPLSADANGAYSLADAPLLASLDQLGLLMLEQPFAADALLAHAKLARLMRTPLCLDESIISVETAADAIEAGACRVVNIKMGRVGGVLEAKRIHDVCRDRAVDAWCGGMFETGVGRAANLALAGLEGFTLPAEVSPPARHYTVDIVQPHAEMVEGRITVPTGPGLGVEVLRDVVDSFTTEVETVGG